MPNLVDSRWTVPVFTVAAVPLTPEASFLGAISTSPVTIASYVVPGAGSAPNPMLVVFAFTDGSAGTSVTGVTWNGNALTLAKAQADGTTATRVEIWYLANPTPGTGNVAVTTSSSTWFAAAAIFSGLAAQAPEAVAGQATGTTGLTTSITTLTNNAVIVDCYGTRDVAPTNNGAQSPLVASVAAGGGIGISYKTAVTAGSNSMAWTNTSSGRLVHALAAFALA